MSVFKMDDFRNEMRRRRVDQRPDHVPQEGGRRESWHNFVSRTTSAARRHMNGLARFDASVEAQDPRDHSQTATVGELRERYRSLVVWLEGL